MKKLDLTVIAILVVSIFAFQPTNIEAKDGAAPAATPTPEQIAASKAKPKVEVPKEVSGYDTHTSQKHKSKGSDHASRSVPGQRRR